MSGLVNYCNGLHGDAFQYGVCTSTRVLAIQKIIQGRGDIISYIVSMKHLHDCFAKMLRTYWHLCS
jgi:hypothetical protein